MRSRAAILPYPCDPFLLNYWLSFYDNVWGSEVDKLYVYANSNASDEVFDYIKDRCSRSKNVELLINRKQTEHGECINQTLNHVTEKYIVLLEDDCFIFKPGNIDDAFNILETGTCDIIGSKRGSCSQEILDRCKEIYNLSYEGLGDQGCNFWPNLFFTQADILRNTSRQFGARHWNAGEYYEPLNHTFKEEAAGDTFVNTSLELRAKGYRIVYIPQYHANVDDIGDYENKRFLFDGNAPWVHAGSLSSGVSGLIRDQYNRPLTHPEMQKSDRVILDNAPATEMQRWEYTRRVTFWQMAWDKREVGMLPEFEEQYRVGLERIIQWFGLDKHRINRMKRVYNTLGL